MLLDRILKVEKLCRHAPFLMSFHDTIELEHISSTVNHFLRLSLQFIQHWMINQNTLLFIHACKEEKNMHINLNSIRAFS